MSKKIKKGQFDLIEDITVEELRKDGLVEEVAVSGESSKKKGETGSEATDAVKANAETKSSIDGSAPAEAGKEDHVGQGPGKVDEPEVLKKSKAATDAASDATTQAEPPKTKAGLINAVYQQLVNMKTEEVANVYSTLANPALPPKAQEPSPMQTGDNSTDKDEKKEAAGDPGADEVQYPAAKTQPKDLPGQKEAAGDPGADEVQYPAAEKQPEDLPGQENGEDESEKEAGENEDEDEGEDKKETNESLKVLLQAEKSLTEDFRSKASSLFESAVKTKVAAEVALIEKNYNTRLNEEVATVTTQLAEKVDSYLNYVVQTWMEENKVAIESGLRTEIAENFIGALKNVFTESYIEVPEGKENLVDTLNKEVAKLEEQLLKTTESNMKLTESVSKLERAQVIAEASKDLASTEAVKLVSLVEDVDFENAEAFAKKVQSIKESYFRKSAVKQSTTQTAVETTLNEEAELSPLMAAASAAISRTVKP